MQYTFPFFNCSRCGHRNKVAKTVRSSYRLFLTGNLPNCHKCGCRLKSRNYVFKETQILAQVRKELRR